MGASLLAVPKSIYYVHNISVMFSSAFRFFVLALVYLICGILIKKFKMRAEGLTEMVPNYEFWADIPSLIKVRSEVKSKKFSKVPRLKKYPV